MSSDDITRFVLTGPGMTPRVLRRAIPRERRIEYAERLIQAVDGVSSELAGSGQRLHVPIDLDCYVEPPDGERWTRLTTARELARFMADIETADAVTFGPASYEVYRIRCLSRAVTGRGWRLTIRLYGRGHEFIDRDGTELPLA